jgi:HEAT repeat protein
VRILLLLAGLALGAEYDVPGDLKRLKSADPGERKAACEALKAGSALSYAASELSSRDGAAVSHALEKLSKMDRPGLKEAVLACDEKRDCALLKEMAEKEKTAVVDGLLYGMSDPEKSVRGACLSALFIAGPGQRPEETVLRGFRALDKAPRQRRLNFLATMGGLTHPLILGLSDQDAEIRLFCAQELGRKKDQEAIPALEDATRDEDERVSSAAISALASTLFRGKPNDAPRPSSDRKATRRRKP